MRKIGIKKIFISTIPVLAGYIFLGIAFGLVMRTKGFPLWYPMIMSVVIYSGALEFAAVPILAGTFDPLGSFVLGVLISARHLFYGIPMLKKYKNMGKSKLMLIFGLTDETFSILTTVDVPEGVKPKHYYLGVTVLDYMYWNIGTIIGALFGNVLQDKATGLDFALTALFIVLFIEQLKNKAGIISGITGFMATLFVLLMFGSANVVIISLIIIVIVLLVGRRAIEHE